MHCGICSEENPCPDCLVEEVRYAVERHDITSDRTYHTQGGGTVRWDGNQYVFVEVPEWGDFKVGDPLPDQWSIA